MYSPNILTESEAVRIFGEDDAVGQMLRFNSLHEFTVTAVVKDPDNFHLPVSALGSFSSLPFIERDDDHDRHLFSYMNFITYVLLHKGTDAVNLSRRFEDLLDGRYPDRRSFDIRLRPLNDIYFNSELRDSPPTRHGNLALLRTLVAVAALIMLIAMVNFVNLSTANASVRASEIGVRKIMGAGKQNLVMQFLTESVLTSMLAFLIALLLVELLLPVFNTLLLTDLSFNPFSGLLFPFALIVLVLLTGLLAGIYPAFYLSSLRPGKIIRGDAVKGRGALSFRRFLIVIQFTISIAMITGTLLIERQVMFMRNKHPGFNKENVILIRLNRDVYSSGDLFRSNLLRYDEIVSVSLSNNLPGYVTWFNTWIIDGENKPHKFLPVDPDYIDLMEINLVSGRNFDWNRTADQEYTYILNEEAVRYFGFDEPAGKEFMVGGSRPVRIAGVVKDFHFRSLHEPIGPLVLGWQPRNLTIANIRTTGENIERTIELIKGQWDLLSPGSPFEYRFLESELDRLYQTEIRISRLFRYFAILAVIIACLGLYGLSTFVALQKTREIGIRKVLGSGVNHIIFMLAWEFARWVIISNLIAWPAAWFVMSGWLDNFPYRIEPGIFMFISAGLIAFFIAMATVSGQALKAALSNPVDTLRYE